MSHSLERKSMDSLPANFVRIYTRKILRRNRPNSKRSISRVLLDPWVPTETFRTSFTILIKLINLYMKLLKPEDLIESIPNPLKYDKTIVDNLRPYLELIKKEVRKVQKA